MAQDNTYTILLRWEAGELSAVEAALALGHALAELEQDREGREDVMSLEDAAAMVLAYYEAKLEVAIQDYYEWDGPDDGDEDDEPFDLAVL
jgi:uncharacterized membrane protein YkoI